MKKISELGISPCPLESHKQFVIAKDDGSVVAASNYRDARLITAAPELYDCLREAVEQSCNECEDDTIENCRGKCHIARWRDALAKASGEIEVK